jgi:hypothetical protein
MQAYAGECLVPLDTDNFDLSECLAIFGMCLREHCGIGGVLYMCHHTTIYVSSYYYICVLILPKCVLILLYVCLHTTMCPHTAICVSSYYCVPTYYYMCILTLICVLILLYMCPHILLYVSSYCHICVLILLCVLVLLGLS